MSEYKSSLPVRNSENTADGFDELQIKTKENTELSIKTDEGTSLKIDNPLLSIADLNATSRITNVDGSKFATITEVEGQYGLDVHMIDPIPLEVDITHENDSVLVYGFDGEDNQPLAVNATGQLKIDETTLSTLATEVTLGEIKDNSDIIAGWNDDVLNIAKVKIEDITDIVGQESMENSIPVTIASNQSVLNVNVVSAVSVNPVRAYDTIEALAVGNTDDIVFDDFAATGGKLQEVCVSASGRTKVEIKVGTVGEYETQRVGFTTAANLNFMSSFSSEVIVGEGDNVIISVTNMEPGQPFDIYADIGGLLD